MANLVLVVTNESVDAAILQSVLPKAKDGPFAIEWVTRLSHALDRLRLGGVDIVLVDLSLPDSQGIETFDKLFLAAPETPIMTITSDEEDELATEAVLRGAQGFLSKGNFRNTLLPQSLRNIILRKAVEASLFQEKVFSQSILNSISDAVISTDTSGVVTFLNAAAERLTGCSSKEAIGHIQVDTILRIVDRETRASIENPIEQVLRENKEMDLQGNLILIRRDGYESAIEESTAPIHNRRNELIGAVMVFRDIGPAQATMVRKLTHLAQHDFLTELPNRVLLIDRLTQSIELAKRSGTQFAVMYLDLDNFKNINDSLGHAVGDNLIKSVAQHLVSCARSSDTVSRLGGDEFVLLALDMHAEQATHTAKKILAAVALVNKFPEYELYVTSSIGISMYPDDGDAETLIKNADTAMYHAKKMGRNNFQFFNSEMNVMAVERQTVEAELRRALQRNEFLLYYQPQVNLASSVITGAEALIRWQHPQRGLLEPALFISIAEECGLIVPMGRWVLREACKQAKTWENAGLNRITMAVNVSPLEFSGENYLTEVQDILASTELDPCFLELELTESILMRDAELSKSILDDLKKMGVTLAIDDFGTGYSSLSYLQRFPIDVLKIDRSFVKGVEQLSSDGLIVRAIIGLGKSLGQRVIAEGIETETQYVFLKSQHCDEGQGYYFSRPLAPEHFIKLFEAGKFNL